MNSNLRTVADYIAHLSRYPDNTLVGVMTDYGSVPLTTWNFYGPGENYDDSPAVVVLKVDNYAGEDWERK